ncbi:hypothetical protein TRIUR3_23334 [Triticum urartu]|uniref:Uncharacterized protein n=1 Tax=Triticum urartu TaxID=4572 RepID=M7ZLE4_TRIUA|nr:hypothetical protein TRIUR3_23334 [Triticum urartu]
MPLALRLCLLLSKVNNSSRPEAAVRKFSTSQIQCPKSFYRFLMHTEKQTSDDHINAQ